MKTKSHLLTLAMLCNLGLSTAQASANENTFQAIGKITESPSDHTTKHEHDLSFVRLSDGETFDIVDSPELLKAHCESGKNSVVEIEGYRTGKFLFWGGNLVVTGFKVHEDIAVPTMAHVVPKPVRSAAERKYSSRL